MKKQNLRKFSGVLCLLISLCLIIGSFIDCGGGAKNSGDPQYEAQIITIEREEWGEPSAEKDVKKISISELRALPQHNLDASYMRTTGLEERFKMQGPYVSDVFSKLGLNLQDYAGLGVVGLDGYYCLLTKEVIAATPDLMLALVVNGKARLLEGEAPVRLAVQGQYGPYWVKQIEKIILLEEIPAKEISTLWVFNNLAQGIDSYAYEYYGSKDKALLLSRIFSRLDSVNDKAFFTMKSADGFEKNEAMHSLLSDYYIKVEGEDAPTNVSPNIKLGMNVKLISWISTNADAMVFPEMLKTYMDLKTIDGQEGLPLSEILFETGMDEISGCTFDLFGTKGEKLSLAGDSLKKAVLCSAKDGSYPVVFDSSLGVKNLDNLMKIKKQPVASELNAAVSPALPVSPAEKKDLVLVLRGNGLEKPSSFTLAELKALKGYSQNVYSMLNNWPTKKVLSAKGVRLDSVLASASIKPEAALVRVYAKDGYNCTFTKKQLLQDGYYFPQLAQSSAEGSVKVPALLAWAIGDSTDVSQTEEVELRLVLGQRGLNDMNTEACVKDVAVIEVLTENPGKWEVPTLSPPAGQINAETLVAISYAEMDRVKLYYTLDGSRPTYKSAVYNPSTSYFQPELTKPIKISGSTTIQVFASGWGKEDSDVASFSYTLK